MFKIIYGITALMYAENSNNSSITIELERAERSRK